MSYVKEYKKLEKEFALDFTYYFKEEDIHINYPTEHQDIFEHWDLEIVNSKILSGKYDVKGLRKVNRYDDKVNESIQWIELVNVRGNLGWVFGLSDYIAFEHINDWVIVDRLSLIKYVKENVNNETLPYPEINKLYRRGGRLDLITLVSFFELMKICKMIIPKYK